MAQSARRHLLAVIGLLLLLAGCGGGGGGGGSTVAPPPSNVPRFAYVVNFASNNVSAYTIDATTGALAPIDADPLTAGIQNFPAGTSPNSVTVDPSGKFAYVANRNSSNVSAYTINAATGALAPIDANPLTAGIQNFPAGTTPFSVTVDPSGKFVYVPNLNSNNVSAYTIDATTGALAPIDADPLTAGIQNFPAGTTPVSVTVDPSGKFAYVANFASDNVSAYTINATTGALAPIDADPLTAGIQNFPAGNSPMSVTVDPSGKFVYVANLSNSANSVSAYTLDATTGALAPIDADPLTAGIQNFPAGTNPNSVTVDPSGKFAYVANQTSNNVSAYTINITTGALAPIDADPLTAGIQNFPAGTNPNSVTVDPSGKFAYVANVASNNVSAYTINATTGALAPIDADPLTVGIQNFPAGGQPASVTTTR